MSEQAGATLVEFSLAGFVFVLLLFGLIDITRFIATRAVLEHGAQHGLSIAQSLSFLDVEISTLPSSAPEYQLYLRARRRVAQEAARLPESTLLSGLAGSSLAGFVQMEQLDRLTNTTRRHPATVILLRPGEAARNLTSGKLLYHPTLCPPGAGCSYGDRRSTDSWRELLRTHPFVVAMRAEIRPIITLFFARIEIGAVASGYRELPASSRS